MVHIILTTTVSRYREPKILVASYKILSQMWVGDLIILSIFAPLVNRKLKTYGETALLGKITCDAYI